MFSVHYKNISINYLEIKIKLIRTIILPYWLNNIEYYLI